MLIWILSFSLFTPLLQKPTLLSFQLFSSLIPSIAISWGFYVIDTYEARETNLNWNNLFEYSRNDGISMGLVMCMLVFDSIIFGFITWCIGVVKPRQVKNCLVFKKIYTRQNTTEHVTHISIDETRIEPPLESMEVGIQVKDVSKIYDNNVIAVDSLNLDIYKGHITAILGHSDSGKTTLLSILTGIISPTTGSICINNVNINNNVKVLQHDLGLCPQNNLLFPYLTVSEHLVYSSMVKGFSKPESEKYASETIQLLKLTHKKNEKLSKLSYGIHRSVSVGIAIIGQPQVLVLDEPTTGLDPESKQALWDTVSSLRENRIIIISTKYMEEADFFGDWIAVLDHGHVKNYGTNAFIKQVYGTGYLLKITKGPLAAETDITKAVENCISGVTTLGSFRTQITYQITTKNSPDLSELFSHLEHEKSSLGITNMSITSTTIEDEYLRTGEFGENNLSSPISDEHSQNYSVRRLTGFTHIWEQFKALFKKKTWYMLHSFCILILFMVTSILLIILALPIRNLDKTGTLSPLTISLTAYNNAVVMMPSLDTDTMEASDLFEDFVTNNGGSIQHVSADITKVLLKVAEEKANSSSRVIAVTYLTRSNWTVLYNRILTYAPAIALNLVTNTLIKSLKGPAFGIITLNHPLNVKNFESTCNDYKTESGENAGYMWVILLPQGLLLFVSNFVTLPALERITLTKHLQLMSGVTPLIYWASLFICDLFIYITTITIMIFGVFIFDETYYFADSFNLGILALILLLYGLCGIVQTYVFSLYGDSVPESISVYLVTNICTGERRELVSIISDRLSKKYSCHVTALKCISFQIVPGECFGLLGINGSGKTTIFKLLSAYEVPTLGDAFASGIKLNTSRAKYMAQIGYCPQVNSLIDILTPEKMLMLFGSLRGVHPKKISDEIDKWLKLLGLQEYRKHTCDRLNDGNKRKVCVGMALIGSPPVLLLDEPTTGIDNVARCKIWNILMKCQTQGQAIVLSSHSSSSEL